MQESFVAQGYTYATWLACSCVFSHVVVLQTKEMTAMSTNGPLDSCRRSNMAVQVEARKSSIPYFPRAGILLKSKLLFLLECALYTSLLSNYVVRLLPLSAFGINS